MAKLSINLLGRVEFEFGEKQLEHKLSNKGTAFISLLMLDPGKQISREKVIAYLWADSDEEAARYNLRYNLWNIKKLIPTDEQGNELILSHKDNCRINPAYQYKSDVRELSRYEMKGRDASIEELIACKELFRGDFLEGIYLKNCDEFNEKIILERMVYQNKYIELLKKIADNYETCKKYKECIQALNELICIEPYNEAVAHKQICAYINWGKRTEAISYYKKFEATLRSNLNVFPGKELKDLYTKLTLEPRELRDESPVDAKLTKQTIEMEVNCIENIDYFCISEIIRKIMLKADRKYVFGLNKCYLEDLNFIQLEVGLGYERLYNDKCFLHASLPSVRVVDAVAKLILYISEIYQLQIKIVNPKDMDQASFNIIKYINQLQIEDVTFINFSTESSIPTP